MLTAEANLAIGRLRRVESGERLEAVYHDPQFPQATNYWMAYEEDVKTCSAAYLRDHPPDDDTLLDEEFLRGLGWERQKWGDAFEKKIGGLTLELFRTGVLTISQGPDCSIEWPTKIRTRGQLRRMLAVLGEGKEGGE